MFINAKELVFKGRDIIFFDNASLDDERLIHIMDHNSREIAERGQGGQLMVIDVTHVVPSPKSLACCKRNAAVINRYVVKIAVIGIPHILGSFLSYLVAVFKMDLRIFHDLDSAREWLVKD